MHLAETLVVLGGAFRVCGLIARVGVPIRLPTIPLFMLAGVLLGPSTPGFDLVQDPAELELVARLGLVFLLFYLGLEFSLDQLVAGGRRLVATAVIYLVLNVGGGLLLGLSFGWGIREALVVAGVVGISSSAIVTKLLVDLRRLGNRESRVILGIIVIEDVFLALYLALLQPMLGDAEDRRRQSSTSRRRSVSSSRSRWWLGTGPAGSAASSTPRTRRSSSWCSSGWQSSPLGSPKNSVSPTPSARS
jgi:monovalent cation:H+ antiporter-2, CPA2 family